MFELPMHGRTCSTSFFLSFFLSFSLVLLFLFHLTRSTCLQLLVSSDPSTPDRLLVCKLGNIQGVVDVIVLQSTERVNGYLLNSRSIRIGPGKELVVFLLGS